MRGVLPARFQAASIVNLCGIHQHHWNIVLNGVHTAAFAAFQTLAVGIEDHRLLADRANQHVQHILRDHIGFIVARGGWRERSAPEGR